VIHQDLLFRAMPFDTDPFFVLPAGSVVHLSLSYCFMCLMRRRVNNYLIFFSEDDRGITVGPRDVVVRTSSPIRKWQPVPKVPLKELLDRSVVRQMELEIQAPEHGTKTAKRRQRYRKSLKKMEELVDKLPENDDAVSKRRFRIV